MITNLVFLVTIFYFILASLEDLKKREVYDYINYSYMFLIFLISLAYSLIINSFEPIIYTIIGMVIGFGLGSIFYFIGVWGGGDTKFLIGFGGSVYYLINFGSFFTNILFTFPNLIIDLNSNTYFIFIAKFLLIINLIYIILILINFFSNKKSKIDNLIVFLIFLLFTLFTFFKLELIHLVILSFATFVLIFFSDEKLFQPLTILKYKINLTYILAIDFLFLICKLIFSSSNSVSIFIYLLIFTLFSFLIGGVLATVIVLFNYIKHFKKIKLVFNSFEKTFLYLIGIMGLISFFYSIRISFLFFIIIVSIIFIRIAKATESYIFVSEKNINEIVFGDWIVQDVIVKKKVIFKVEDFRLGVSEEQLKKIVSLSKKNKELKKLLVKDGIAFIPPMLIGFLFIIFI